MILEDLVLEMLEKGGWKAPFHRSLSGLKIKEKDLILEIEWGANGKWLRFRAKGRTLDFENCVADACHLIEKMNLGAPLGNLLLDLKESTSYFQTSLLCEGIELSGQILNNCLNNCIRGFHRYHYGLELLADGSSMNDAYVKAMSRYISSEQ